MDQGYKYKKPINRREDANILSILTFAYTIPTFVKGFRNGITEDDIPEICKTHDATYLGNKLEKNWDNQILSGKPSLWKALGRSFGIEFMMTGAVYCFDEIVLRLLRPIAVAQLLRYFAEHASEISEHEAYAYGGVIVISSIISAFINRLCTNASEMLGLKARVACGSLIYRKCLKLNKSALGRMANGHLTNLLANDLNRVSRFPLYAHYIWIVPIQVMIMAYVMYVLEGYEATVGILFIILIVPIQMVVGRQSSKYRLRTALKTDQRSRLMTEIITGIKLIKMYAWEEPFTQLMENIRREEVCEVRVVNYIKSFIKFIIVTPKVAIFIAIGVCVLTRGNITASYAFVVACFYDILKITLIIGFVYGMNDRAETLISIKRLQDLLLLDENQNTKTKRGSHTIEDSLPPKGKPIIELKEARVKWSKDSPEYALNGVNFIIKSNQLIGIIGLVGSGKSSILQAILKELILESGSINIEGRISYASQEPWIFSGNIQQNILFGKPMDFIRYRDVIKACALEQDLNILPHGDQSLVGERGIILSGGQKARVNLARTLYRDADIYLLDDPLSAVDVHVGKHLLEKCIKTFLNQKSTILVTHQTQYLNVFDYIYVVDKGSITAKGTYEELRQSSIIQQLHSEEEMENHGLPDSDHFQEVNIPSNYSNKGSAIIVREETTAKGAFSIKTFLHFLNAIGSPSACIGVLLIFITSQIAFTASDYILAYWINENQRKMASEYSSPLSETSYAWIYTGLILIMTFLTLVRSFGYFGLLTKLSWGLHKKMFSSVIKAPMSFYYLNNSGRILNRFTKDIGVIDDDIGFVLNEIMQILLTCLGIVIIVCVVNPWMLISTVIVFSLTYALRMIYLRTSQSLVRIEGIARSPIFCHINETLQGLTSIRAHNSEVILQKEFDKHQNFHSSVFSTITGCTRALSLYGELVCILYTATIVFSIIPYKSEYFAGNVGVAITQSFNLLGMLFWGIQQLIQFDIQFSSVERILEYCNLESEELPNKLNPPADWPKNGNIKFVSLSLKYNRDAAYALRNINLDITARDKIGVVGRTGAGKSSLLVALFQLSNTEGAIFVDDVDITTTSVHSLRSKISIIPQDPVLFYGTVRTNLDPFKMFVDADLWKALEQVQLKQIISELPLGLNHLVSDGGANFSVGQRQLICLARALLRKNIILVLDEATANVDPYTDALIQETIRREFAACTVITIAHRLNTIMDSDKIIVMNTGEIVEYDHPHLLLQNETGTLYAMVKETGSNMANILTDIAESSYKNKRRI